MSSGACLLCSQVVDATTPPFDDKETRQIRISTLCEVLLSSTHTRRKVTLQFEEDETCELCPVCAPMISEMGQFRDQMSALEEQIGTKITEIREIMQASSGENGDDGGDKAHKLRTSLLKMMGDNDDQLDDNFALDEVLIKVEQDDGDVFLGGDDGSFDDYNSSSAVSDMNNEEDTFPVKYEGIEDDDDFDESAFCISPHPQKRGRGRPRKDTVVVTANPPRLLISPHPPKRRGRPPKSAVTTNPLRPKTKRNLESDSSLGNLLSKRIKAENKPLREATRHSTRPKKTVLPPKGVNKTLTVSLERISVPPVTKSSPISSPSSSPFHNEDTTSSHQDNLPSDDLEHQKSYGKKTQPIRPHNCPSCRKTFTTESTLSYHIARMHCIPCTDPHCTLGFSSVKARNSHRSVAHPRIPAYEGGEGFKTRAQSLQMAEQVIDIYKNQANREPRKTMKLCREQNIPRSSVYRYLKMFKDKDTIEFKKPPGPLPKSERPPPPTYRPFKCSSCPKKFISRPALFSHVARDHTRAKEHVCHLCGRNFYTIFTLRTHLRTHDESLRPRCETCGEKFLHGSTLQSHLVKVHGADPGATFATLKGLQDHKRTHTGLKPHKCDQCDSAFSSKQLLRNHIKSHSDQRPHACPHCERAFKMKAQLQIHIRRIHTPGYVAPTPYKCDQCGKGFQFPYVLNTHVVQAHTGERPFTCDQCGKGFAVKSALTLHLKVKHGIEVAVVKNRLPRSKRDTFHVPVEQDNLYTGPYSG
ncbi:Zinc finger protein 45 [Folsomia candida]|uniref:Zinc finger protein 45 n=1 Tax=Folsomia candida TaxID=158441 RepID=A0A226D4R9_FOLCA|nr:Zinc finger protein 45 [Folsomia candida]